MWFLSLVLDLNATSIGSLHHDTSTLQRISSLLGKKNLQKKCVHASSLSCVSGSSDFCIANVRSHRARADRGLPNQLHVQHSSVWFMRDVNWTSILLLSVSSLPPSLSLPHASTPYTASLRGGTWSFLSVCRTQPCYVHGYTDTRRSCMLCRGWVCFLARSASCTHNSL